MSTSESLWLKNIFRNRSAGIKSLFEKYYTPLVMFAGSYLRNDEVAKDIVQDVFYALVSGSEKFATIDNLNVYLYSAVKNKCLKYIRHEDVKKRYEHYILLHDETTYQESILEEEVFRLLNQAIHELPVQCQKVFLLTLEGKGNTEIAELLGISVETVKSHKKAGKKMLYAKLKDVVPLVILSWYFSILSF